MLESKHDEMKAFEERLGSWVPSLGNVDRERMLFEAGRASGLQSTPWAAGSQLWRLATAATLLLSVGLGLAWQHERGRNQALEQAVLVQHAATRRSTQNRGRTRATARDA